MKLSNVVAVVLRLFAIYWLFTGLIHAIGALAFPNRLYGEHSSLVLILLTKFGVPGTYAVMALIIWLVADKAAATVVAGRDPEMRTVEIGVSNLYTLGFLIIGLIFFLSYLGSMVSWLHYLAQSNETRSLTGDRGLPLYDIIGQVAPCMGGLGAVIMAPRLGRLIAANHPVPPHAPRS